jgi:ATP-binding cassette subfamily F protein uup
MVLLSIENIAKTLKDAPLFEGVTFGMNEGERIGLVGPNGCGKSTFLKILAGSMQSDAGTIATARGLTVSLLDQQPLFSTGQRVSEFLFESAHPTVDLLKSYHRLLADHPLDTEAGAAKLHTAMEEIESVHGWDIETRYASFLSELQGPAMDATMDTLSGGMIRKVAIARVFAVKPDVVLLDEPTNHLDIATIQWLERYLVQQQCSAILVTHDRYLLDHVCTSIFEFDRGRVFTHPGSYSQFLQRRADRLSNEQAEQNRLKTVLRREMEWLSRGPKARAGKDSGRKARIVAMQQSLSDAAEQAAAFTSLQSRMGKKILDLEGVGKVYQDKTVVKPFSHSFLKGDRVGLIGPNGSGKTTVLDMIVGRVKPDFGVIDTGVNTVFGYYDQLDSFMDRSKTVLEHISEIADEVTIGPGETMSAARFLEFFGFPTSFHRIEIARLSGGERRRLHLIEVLLHSPNFLLLDEPTNDLDIDTIRRLEEYLIDFTGCVLVVSHDRAFLDRIADTLFVFSSDGGIEKFAGSYSDYASSELAIAATQAEKQVQKPTETKQNRSVKRDRKRRLTFNEQKEFGTIVDEIELLEQRISVLEMSFSDPEAPAETLADRTQEYHEARQLLEDKMERWEFLAQLAEES